MTDDGPSSDHQATTGLPAPLRTWRRVYAVVAVLFAVYVVLLVVLQRAFR